RRVAGHGSPGDQHPARAAQPGDAVHLAHRKEAGLTATPSSPPPATKIAPPDSGRAEPARAPVPVPRARRVVWAFLRRDVTVVRRELAFFLMRTAMQPLMVTIVFGYLLPRMRFMNRAYTTALLPGVLAVSLALAAVQSVALPMVADFGYTREIE